MSYSSRRSSSSLGNSETGYNNNNDNLNEPSERKGTGGQMLFTGPDYIRDHRVTVEPEHHYVGIGTMSPEGTSEIDYLWRSPSRQNYPRPKSTQVGAIGWGVPHLADAAPPHSGAQIMLGEFRQAVEDKHTHLYQNAWYPGANESGSYHHSNLVTIERSRCGSAKQAENPDRRVSSASASTYNSNNNNARRSGSGYGYRY